jgi:hypothetical protein
VEKEQKAWREALEHHAHSASATAVGLGEGEMRTVVQGSRMVINARAVATGLRNSERKCLDDFSPAEAFSMGLLFGGMGASLPQFGPGACRQMTKIVEAVEELTEGCADIQQGFYRYWLPGQEQPVAAED